MAYIALARRYARALLEVATEQNSVEAVSAQLQRIADAVERSPELRAVLGSPSYDRATRLKVLQGLLAAAGATPVALDHTLRLLNDRSRLTALPAIALAFRDLADQRHGRVRGTVTSATPLSPALLQQLTEQLASLSGKQVLVETRVDPSLLGGVSAQIGSTLYDGSLRTQLHALRTQLGMR